MKHLKTYRLFESSMELTPEQVEWLDQCTSGTWQLNPQTGLVDVDGGFNCSNQRLSDLKDVRFGEVVGYFDCRNNQLTSLEGAPREVGGTFDCANNQLTSPEGAPREVGRNFYCNGNQLTSLEGAPQEVELRFFCSDNPVPETTLKSIFSLMKRGKSYQEALESRWDKISQKDKILLWRPEFRWVGPEEARALQALQAYQGFKGMI